MESSQSYVTMFQKLPCYQFTIIIIYVFQTQKVYALFYSHLTYVSLLWSLTFRYYFYSPKEKHKNIEFSRL